MATPNGGTAFSGERHVSIGISIPPVATRSPYSASLLVPSGLESEVVMPKTYPFSTSYTAMSVQGPLYSLAPDKGTDGKGRYFHIGSNPLFNGVFHEPNGSGRVDYQAMKEEQLRQKPNSVAIAVRVPGEQAPSSSVLTLLYKPAAILAPDAPELKGFSPTAQQEILRRSRQLETDGSFFAFAEDPTMPAYPTAYKVQALIPVPDSVPMKKLLAGHGTNFELMGNTAFQFVLGSGGSGNLDLGYKTNRGTDLNRPNRRIYYLENVQHLDGRLFAELSDNIAALEFTDLTYTSNRVSVLPVSKGGSSRLEKMLNGDKVAGVKLSMHNLPANAYRIIVGNNAPAIGDYARQTEGQEPAADGLIIMDPALAPVAGVITIKDSKATYAGHKDAETWLKPQPGKKAEAMRGQRKSLDTFATLLLGTKDKKTHFPFRVVFRANAVQNADPEGTIFG